MIIFKSTNSIHSANSSESWHFFPLFVWLDDRKAWSKNTGEEMRRKHSDSFSCFILMFILCSPYLGLFSRPVILGKITGVPDDITVESVQASQRVATERWKATSVFTVGSSNVVWSTISRDCELMHRRTRNRPNMWFSHFYYLVTYVWLLLTLISPLSVMVQDKWTQMQREKDTRQKTIS